MIEDTYFDKSQNITLIAQLPFHDRLKMKTKYVQNEVTKILDVCTKI